MVSRCSLQRQNCLRPGMSQHERNRARRQTRHHHADQCCSEQRHRMRPGPTLRTPQSCERGSSWAAPSLAAACLAPVRDGMAYIRAHRLSNFRATDETRTTSASCIAGRSEGAANAIELTFHLLQFERGGSDAGPRSAPSPRTERCPQQWQMNWSYPAGSYKGQPLPGTETTLESNTNAPAPPTHAPAIDLPQRGCAGLHRDIEGSQYVALEFRVQPNRR